MPLITLITVFSVASSAGRDAWGRCLRGAPAPWTVFGSFCMSSSYTRDGDDRLRGGPQRVHDRAATGEPRRSQRATVVAWVYVIGTLLALAGRGHSGMPLRDNGSRARCGIHEGFPSSPDMGRRVVGRPGTGLVRSPICRHRPGRARVDQLGTERMEWNGGMDRLTNGMEWNGRTRKWTNGMDLDLEWINSAN